MLEEELEVDAPRGDIDDDRLNAILDIFSKEGVLLNPLGILPWDTKRFEEGEIE